MLIVDDLKEYFDLSNSFLIGKRWLHLQEILVSLLELSKHDVADSAVEVELEDIVGAIRELELVQLRLRRGRRRLILLVFAIILMLF